MVRLGVLVGDLKCPTLYLHKGYQPNCSPSTFGGEKVPLRSALPVRVRAKVLNNTCDRLQGHPGKLFKTQAENLTEKPLDFISLQFAREVDPGENGHA